MKHLLLAFLIFTLPLPAFAAIVRDSSAAAIVTATSLTYAHTVAGTDRGLIVTVGTFGSSGADLITGCTYNGVAMTRINTTKPPTDVQRLYLYYLNAPATGANNVVCSASISTYIEAKSVSYTGVKQTGQPETQTTSAINGAALSNTLVPTTNNSIHVVAFSENACRTTNSVSNATSISPDYFGCGPLPGSGLWESNPLLISPAASHTITLTPSPNEQMASVGVTLAPSAGAPPAAITPLWPWFTF